MNEVFDKMIIRVLFALFVCLMVYLYRSIHAKLPLPSKKQMVGPYSPETNPADTLHLCAKIIGIGIIFSDPHFDLTDGISFAFFDSFVHLSLACFFYMISLYIIDGIVLYNFEYKDEIIKKQNFAYAIVCLIHSLCVALLTKVIMVVADDSLILLLFLWILSMALLGLGSRLFRFFSKISFNTFMAQMNLGVALSYSGFILGLTIIIAKAMERPFENIESFSTEAFLSIILSLMILPIFTRGLTFIFNINYGGMQEDEAQNRTALIHLGHGIYEGGLFLASCYLTGSITEQIYFGPFYP